MLHEFDIARIDLNLLTLFEVVMQERHAGHAAARLNLSPSAVSHGLARLRRVFNDPLLIKVSGGLQPTPRAVAIEPAVAEILMKVREVVAQSLPFDPESSARHFRLGAVGGAAMVLAPALMGAVEHRASHVSIDLRRVDWQSCIADLDQCALDIAIVQSAALPDRFVQSPLYEEPMVAAMRIGHAYARTPTLEGLCAHAHVAVTLGEGDPDPLDAVLAGHRHIRMTVPSFSMALSVAARSDLLAVVPRSEAVHHARQLRLQIVPLPAEVPPCRFDAVMLRQSLQDDGLAWLRAELERAGAAVRGAAWRDGQLELFRPDPAAALPGQTFSRPAGGLRATDRQQAPMSRF